MNTDAIRMWDGEAAAFDEPADHGLHDPAVREAWRDLLLGALPPAPARIADLGCGTATLSLLLADAGYAVDAVDFSPAMVRLAREKVGVRTDVTVTEADAGAPPPPGGRLRRGALPPRAVGPARPGGRAGPVGRPARAGRPAGARRGQLDDRRRAHRGGDSGSAGGSRPGWRVRHLAEAVFWGREITDERYLVVA